MSPNEFMIVTHPVPNKALKVECISSGCALKLVHIRQLYNGASFPSDLGVGFFFTVDARRTQFALKSVLEPSVAITALSNYYATVATYSGSYNQLFCGRSVSDCMYLTLVPLAVVITEAMLSITFIYQLAIVVTLCNRPRKY